MACLCIQLSVMYADTYRCTLKYERSICCTKCMKIRETTSTSISQLRDKSIQHFCSSFSNRTTHNKTHNIVFFYFCVTNVSLLPRYFFPSSSTIFLSKLSGIISHGFSSELLPLSSFRLYSFNVFLAINFKICLPDDARGFSLRARSITLR